MKFIVSALTKCEPRLGNLSHLENVSHIETPAAMLYTQAGSIPHITREVFKMFAESPLSILQVPFVSTYQFLDAMTEFNGKIAEFIGMKECVTCITLQDPGNLTLPGHHIKNGVPIWTRNGKVLITPESYMNAIETFKPDMYYFLSDGDTNISSPTKRVNKAVERTINFYRECLARHKKSTALKTAFVMAPITGGYCLTARDKCIEEILKDDNLVNGFLIDGLHNNGPEVEFLEFSEVKPVVEHVISKLPQEKLRVIHGCYNPLTILKLVKLGVDLFDTSYCYLVTERSAGLTFALDKENVTYPEYEINLRQEKYADDFNPILKNCECLACTSYSRGYIHHLLTVQELLAPVLLSIHNIHHFLKFFSRIRDGIRNGNLDELEKIISEQFDSYMKKLPAKTEQVTPVAQIGDTGLNM